MVVVAERGKLGQKKMPLEEQVRLLKAVDILEPLGEEELEELGRRASERNLAEGEVFHTPEDRGERLYVLKRGRARVYELDPEGGERTLKVTEGGDVFGEMTLVGESLSGVFAQALEPSLVATLGRKDFEWLVYTNPEVGLRIMRLLSERLRETERRLSDLATKDVPARLAGLVLGLVEHEGVEVDGVIKVPTRYTHRQMADMICSSRHVVTRAFARLKEEGAVAPRDGDRHIYVADLDALKRAAEAVH